MRHARRYPHVVRSGARAAGFVVVLVTAGCGGETSPREAVDDSVVPATEIGQAADPAPGGGADAPIAIGAPCRDARGGPLLAFGIHGTHGESFEESLVIDCEGTVVIRGPRPFSTALVDRPGTHRATLAPERLAAISDLAVRLARPVPVPSLPPQGADVFVSAATDPPLSRPLRPGEGSADGEAAALHAGLLEEVLARVPVCAVEVELREGNATLRAGTAGLVVVVLRNPGSEPVRLTLAPGGPVVRDEGGRDVRADADAAVMWLDARLRGLDDAGGPAILPPGAEYFAAVGVVASASPSVLRAELRAEARCGPPDVDDPVAPVGALPEARPWRTFTSPPRTIPVAP